MAEEDKKSDATKSKSSAPTFIGAGKDLVSLLRDLALFLLAALLLLFPAKFNTLLTNAGFEEGSLVGFKWKAKLIDSDTALKEARATITDLKTQLDKTSQALNEAQTKLNDPTLKDQLAKLQEENRQINAASSKVEASVTSTIATNAPLVDKAQTATNSSNMWGVVYSGDASLDDAKYEVDVVAPKLGIPNASIYFRQGSYRSVSVLDDRAQAEQVLPKAKQRRSDAYIVNMSTWCPVTNEKDDYKECVTP